jgi:hypothetical protein
MSRESDNGHVCPKCEETVYHDSCACQPIEDALGQDPLDVYLSRCYSLYLVNNAALITERSNANSLMLLDVLKGHI